MYRSMAIERPTTNTMAMGYMKSPPPWKNRTITVHRSIEITPGQFRATHDQALCPAGRHLVGPAKLNDISQKSCDPALILTARPKQKGRAAALTLALHVRARRGTRHILGVVRLQGIVV